MRISNAQGTGDYSVYNHFAFQEHGSGLTGIYNGSLGTTFFCPVSGVMTKIRWYSRDGQSTNYPVQVVVYESPTIESTAQSYTKIYQSSDVSTTSSGIKSVSPNIMVTYDYSYYVFWINTIPSTGKDRSCQIQGRSGGLSSYLASFTATNVSSNPPASFTMNYLTGTVDSWGGAAVSNETPWFQVHIL